MALPARRLLGCPRASPADAAPFGAGSYRSGALAAFFPSRNRGCRSFIRSLCLRHTGTGSIQGDLLWLSRRYPELGSATARCQERKASAPLRLLFLGGGQHLGQHPGCYGHPTDCLLQKRAVDFFNSEKKAGFAATPVADRWGGIPGWLSLWYLPGLEFPFSGVVSDRIRSARESIGSQ